jgi:dihydroxy-acid dehydratase
MVHEDLRPAQVMTREAFENAIVVCSALGGSTNAPIHLNAIAAHLGMALTNDDWERLGYEIPLLVNLQPVGTYLGEDFHRAGGVPAVVGELLRAGLLPHPDAPTASGRSVRELYEGAPIRDADVIRTIDTALLPNAGFLNLSGNLFDSAIMKTSAISADFRDRYLSDPDDPMAFEGRAAVFDGPEDYHARIDDPALGLDGSSVLVMRGAGPKGYPGGAEVVNMRPPSYLIREGIRALPCIGDGRQSGTSGSASILNASPEAADGGGLALLRTGDRVRIDLKTRRADMLVPEDEIARRRAELEAAGGYPCPASQSPWQAFFREKVRPFAEGMVLTGATEHRDIAAKSLPRNNH